MKMIRKIVAALLVVGCVVAGRADAADRKKMKAAWPDGQIVLKFPSNWHASCINIYPRQGSDAEPGWYCSVAPIGQESDERILIKHASGLKGAIND